jgi:hypothetical protein
MRKKKNLLRKVRTDKKNNLTQEKEAQPYPTINGNEKPG